jgi:hypothetical protein
VKITTKTGSVYSIDDHGICIKTDKDGNRIDSFKPLVMIPVPDHINLLKEVYTLPHGDPVVGQRLYLSGLNVWWITTPVVSIEE